MTELHQELQSLLKHKKSFAYYADRLSTTTEHVQQLLSELRNNEAETANYISELEEKVVEVSNDKGTYRSSIIRAEENPFKRA